MRRSPHVVPASATALALSLAAAAAVAGPTPKGPARVARSLEALTPAGYDLKKSIPWRVAGERGGLRVAAYEEENDCPKCEARIPSKPVVLRLLVRDTGWRVLDELRPHSLESGPDEYPPNLFHDLDRIDLTGGPLVLARTLLAPCGSGTTYYFDLLAIREGKFVLLRSFKHDRFGGYYFVVHRGSVYDADLVCTKGPPRGRNTVHTCALEVKRYDLVGTALVETGRERWHESRGMWWLSDSYRWYSIRRGLERGEIFRESR